MDVLYPRLLVTDFPAAVEFYREVLAELFDVQPVKVIPEAAYANWDLEGQAGLVLYGRAVMADTIGTTALPVTARGPGLRHARLQGRLGGRRGHGPEKHGATTLAPAQDRPAWGPTLRTAHLRTPDGTLLELQSY